MNIKNLAEVVKNLNLDQYIHFSKGERKSIKNSSRAITIILGNTPEALIGTIHEDRGLGVTEFFVSAFFYPKLQGIINKEVKDPKIYYRNWSKKNCMSYQNIKP